MIKIIIGSCHEIVEQKIIDNVCDYFIDNFGLNKDDLFFFSTNGNELGDILCEAYLNKNNYPRQLLPPMSTSTSTMQECDYAIVFNSHRDTDAGHSNGVAYSLPYLVMNVRKNVVEVNLNRGTISLYDCTTRHRLEELSPILYCYDFGENNEFNIERLADRMKKFRRKRIIPINK
jgi:hypothetical protein